MPVSTTEFRNGLKIEIDGEPYVIVEFQHVKPGKGGAFVRTKLKNLINGRVIDQTGVGPFMRHPAALQGTRHFGEEAPLRSGQHRDPPVRDLVAHVDALDLGCDPVGLGRLLVERVCLDRTSRSCGLHRSGGADEARAVRDADRRLEDRRRHPEGAALIISPDGTIETQKYFSCWPHT